MQALSHVSSYPLPCPVLQRELTCPRRMNCKPCTPLTVNLHMYFLEEKEIKFVHLLNSTGISERLLRTSQVDSSDKKARYQSAHLLSKHLGCGELIVQSQLGLQNELKSSMGYNVRIKQSMSEDRQDYLLKGI